MDCHCPWNNQQLHPRHGLVMTTQYLIAHKVRGEPAFDVAEAMECPLCVDGVRDGEFQCNECDGEGIWWITNYGHRAYPYSVRPLEPIEDIGPMPIDLPEHFEVSAAPKGKGSGTKGRDLLEMLGLVKKQEPMTRRSW